MVMTEGMVYYFFNHIISIIWVMFAEVVATARLAPTKAQVGLSRHTHTTPTSPEKHLAVADTQLRWSGFFTRKKIRPQRKSTS